MSKDECVKLIDQLSDKTLSFGCLVKAEGMPPMPIYRIMPNEQYMYDKIGPKTNGVTVDLKKDKVVGHPVYIGDCLSKINSNFIPEKGVLDFHTQQIVVLWKPCGFTKSLNQIMNDSGFEDVNCHCGIERISQQKCKTCLPQQQFKDKNARNLFTFINNIFSGGTTK